MQTHVTALYLPSYLTDSGDDESRASSIFRAERDTDRLQMYELFAFADVAGEAVGLMLP